MSAPLIQNEDQIESRMPLWLAVLANLFSLLITLPFFRFGPQDWVRPMGWEFWVLASELNALLVLPAASST